MNILAFETSTQVCSVALRKNKQQWQRELTQANQHAAVILAMIDALLKEADCQPAELDVIAYSQGPGSFTGLRIASSVAQGLALGWGCNVLGVSCLWAIANAAVTADHAPLTAYVIADARQDEVYSAVYRYENDHWQTLLADQLGVINALPEPVPCEHCYFMGNGMSVHGAAIAEHFGQSLQIYEKYTLPHASTLATLAEYQLVNKKTSCNTLALPNYLRKKVTF